VPLSLPLCVYVLPRFYQDDEAHPDAHEWQSPHREADGLRELPLMNNVGWA